MAFDLHSFVSRHPDASDRDRLSACVMYLRVHWSIAAHVARCATQAQFLADMDARHGPGHPVLSCEHAAELLAFGPPADDSRYGKRTGDTLLAPLELFWRGADTPVLATELFEIFGFDVEYDGAAGPVVLRHRAA